MSTINLLPQGLTLKGKDKILIDGVKKLVFAGFMLFIVAILVVTGYLIYTAVKIRTSVGIEESLKGEIGALSQTEQSFFLVKNRISKIKTVLSKESSNGQILTLNELLNSLSGEAKILEIQITSQKVGLSAVFPTSEIFGTFYKNIILSDLYDTVILKSLSFNPTAGYIATLELIKKAEKL